MGYPFGKPVQRGYGTSFKNSYLSKKKYLILGLNFLPILSKHMRFILYLVFISFFLGCKKGEKDPAISLLSRKERITNKWKLKGGDVTYTYYYYFDNYTFDGVFQVDAWTGAKTRYGVNLHILKNGTFNFTEANGAHQLVASGTWSFNEGVGKEKSKQKITFFITDVASGYTYGYFHFNRHCITFTYDIVRLTNKEMILHGADKLISFDQGDDVTLDATYQFEAEK
jgi:hypothetical protein